MISRERKLELLALACEDASIPVPPRFPSSSLEERQYYLQFYDVARVAWASARRAGHAFRPLAAAFGAR